MTTANITAVARPVLVRELAVQNLREAIISGDIAPGTRLIERELCEALGISRASVREVIRQLEAERLLHVEPRRGPVVTALSADEAREIYEIRAVLESRIAARFAKVATQDDIDHLAALCAEVEALGRAPEHRSSVVRAMTDLLQHMGRVSGLAVTSDLLSYMGARINALRLHAIAEPGRMAESTRELTAMLDAIRARDPEAAAEATRNYVRNACVAAVAHMERGDP